MEHALDPLATFEEALSFLKPDGAMLFSTQLQPNGVTPDWWYIGPRNGHVSLYSHQSLRILARRLGKNLLIIGSGLHLFYSTPQAPLAPMIAGTRARESMRQASLRGPRELFATARELTRLGFVRAALNVKHPVRCLLAVSGLLSTATQSGSARAAADTASGLKQPAWRASENARSA
jgi:hypothetical protein